MTPALTSGHVTCVSPFFTQYLRHTTGLVPILTSLNYLNSIVGIQTTMRVVMETGFTNFCPVVNGRLQGTKKWGNFVFCKLTASSVYLLCTSDKDQGLKIIFDKP